MLAAPEAAVEVEVGAVLAPHLSVVAQRLVLAHLAHLPHLPLLQAEVVPVLVLPARAHLALVQVVVVAVPVAELLLSRQWFSAAMARTTP
jgi:hypothetical protein